MKVVCFFTYGIILFFLTNCNSPEIPTKSIEQKLAPEKIYVGSGVIEGSKSDVYYLVKLKNGKILDSVDISEDFIMSQIALELWDKLGNNSEVKSLRVELERRLNDTTYNVTRSYNLDTLKLIGQCYLQCNKFCQSFIKHTYEETCSQWEVGRLKDCIGLTNNYYRVDSIHGKVSEYAINSFVFGNLKAKNSEETLTCVNFTVDMKRGNGLVNKMDLTLRLDKNLGQVIRVDL